MNASEQENYRALYRAVTKMLAVLGEEGEISARHNLVAAVMDALYDIDGGVFMKKSK